MDEELKEQLRGIIQKHRVVGRAGLIDAILALVITERDAMKESACKAICYFCRGGDQQRWEQIPVKVADYATPDFYWHALKNGRGHDQCHASAIRSLTPSTTQSRERELSDKLLAAEAHIRTLTNCNQGQGDRLQELQVALGRMGESREQT